jgi:hypothetical protein
MRRGGTMDMPPVNIQTINDIIAQRIPAADISDEQILRLSYGIRYFDAGAAGLDRESALFWLRA